MRNNILSPSILSADFRYLEKDIRTAVDAGAQYLHIDVMDGMYVPNISFGLPVIKSIRKSTECFFDVHLMIEQPERYIEVFADAGADLITVHAESTKHLHRVVGQIKECGLKAGVALNPATTLEVLDYLYKDLDMVLLMTVNPGFGGQSLIPDVLRKIQKLRQRIEQEQLNLDIEVDGGISKGTLRDVLDAGANVIVAGSAVFKNDIRQNVEDFLTIMNEYK